MDHPEYMETEDAGRYLAPVRPIPPSTLQWWRHVGRGPQYFKVGKRVIYARADLDAYREACRQTSVPAPAERNQEVLDKEAEKAKEAAARLKAEQEEAPAPARRKEAPANAGERHG
jgi:hypothetical protein